MIKIPDSGKQCVVVIGGGFAGLAAMRTLRKSGMQVVLVDRNNYHQFQPLLYQVATSSLEPTAISFPLRKIIRSSKDFHFLMAKVTGVDVHTKTINTSVGVLSYDYLIVAAGADTNYFGMENIREIALPLKSVSEALSLRNHIYRAMESASRCDDAQQRQAYLNFVIVGGGATGVELAGAVAELRNKVLPKDYPEIDFTCMKIYLVNAGARLLEAFSEKSSQKTLEDLQGMGVEVLLSAQVKDYIEQRVVYNSGESIATVNLIWTSGIIANKIEGIDNTSRGRRVITDDYCRVDGLSDVYAVGDISCTRDGALPQVAQVAIQQGRCAARNIICAARAQEQSKFVYRDKGSMATIGRNRAVAEVGRFRAGGFLAWAMWLFVHLLFIIGVRNKMLVMWDWAWSYITCDQPLRSIIEASKEK